MTTRVSDEVSLPCHVPAGVNYGIEVVLPTHAEMAGEPDPHCSACGNLPAVPNLWGVEASGMGMTLRFCAECTRKALAWAEEMARSGQAKQATGIIIRLEDRRVHLPSGGERVSDVC
jgi:hypothetical protein